MKKEIIYIKEYPVQERRRRVPGPMNIVDMIPYPGRNNKEIAFAKKILYEECSENLYFDGKILTRIDYEREEDVNTFPESHRVREKNGNYTVDVTITRMTSKEKIDNTSEIEQILLDEGFKIKTD